MSAAERCVDDQAEDLNLLYLEVEALRAIHILELTPKQLLGLLPLVKDASEAHRPREPVKGSAQFWPVYRELRVALAAGTDERITKLELKLDQLDDNLGGMPVFDARYELTSVAKKRVAEAMRHVGLSQVVAFTKRRRYWDLVAPHQAINGRLKEFAYKTGRDWELTRDGIANNVAEVIAGLSEDKKKSSKAQLVALLDRWHGKQIETDALNHDVDQVIGEVSGADMLRNVLEIHLAHLLANPKAGDAIRARIDAAKK